MKNPIPKDAEFFRYDPDGPDEPVILDDHQPLTVELMGEIAVRAERTGPPAGLVPGGKSLSGGTTHSPRVAVTLPVQTQEKVKAAAAAEGMSVSKWVRRLIEANVA